ncbi:hypothetical protein [Haploplasma axanthum]|nr:hypothetical protein [Haploplasma axanthum]
MMLNKVAKYFLKKTWKINLIFTIVILIVSIVYILSGANISSNMWMFILLASGQGAVAETILFADKFIFQIPTEKEDLIKGVRKYLIIKNLIILGILFFVVVLKNILSFEANLWEIIVLIGVSIIGYIVTVIKNSYATSIELIPYDKELNKTKIPTSKVIDIIINIMALVMVVIFFLVKNDEGKNYEGVLMFKSICMGLFVVLMFISLVIKKKEYKLKIQKYEVV